MVRAQLKFSGHGLDAKDNVLMGGKSDPYLVLCQNGKEIGRTEVIPNNLDPVWNSAEFEFDESATVEIQCWDKDKGSTDDIIGSAQVQVRDLLAAMAELQLMSPKGKPAGKLRLQGGDDETDILLPECTNHKNSASHKKKGKVDIEFNDGKYDMKVRNDTQRDLEFTVTLSGLRNIDCKSNPIKFVVGPGKHVKKGYFWRKDQYKGCGFSWSQSCKAKVKSNHLSGMHKDSSFAGQRAIGGLDLSGKQIQWLPARMLGGDDAAVLFDGIDPHDVHQGSLGDCWLMCAISALAEHPEKLKKLFKSHDVPRDGKYTVELFNVAENKWEQVVIDEEVPTRTNHSGDIEAVFANPVGEEIWVPLLEKAFAKFYGTYENLDGGYTPVALQTMTGAKECLLYRKNEGSGTMGGWRTCSVNHEIQQKTTKNLPLCHVRNDTVKDAESVWNKMQTHFANQDIMTLSANKTSQSKGEGFGEKGIRTGHAYAVLDVREVTLANGKQERLVHIRNPWGTGEWTGDWGDDSRLWKVNKQVARELNFKSSNDGAFWMNFKDFSRCWNTIYVCMCGVKTRGIGPPLVLGNVDEEVIELCS